MKLLPEACVLLPPTRVPDPSCTLFPTCPSLEIFNREQNREKISIRQRELSCFPLKNTP